MVAKRDATVSFLKDATRMIDEASLLLSDMSASGTVIPEKVHEIFLITHTVKGTATMIAGAEGIASALHALEERLTEEATPPFSLSDLALAKSSFQNVAIEVGKLLDSISTPDNVRPLSRNQSASTGFGILAQMKLGTRQFPIWFSIESVLHVFDSSELPETNVMNFQNAWLPLIGRGAYGIAIEAKAGTEVLRAVIRIDEVLRITDKNEALSVRAVSGTDIIKTPAIMKSAA